MRGILTALIVMLSALPAGLTAQEPHPCETIASPELAQMLLDTRSNPNDFTEYDPDGDGIACEPDEVAAALQNPSGAPAAPPVAPSTGNASAAMARGGAGRTGEQPGPGPTWQPYAAWQAQLPGEASGPVVTATTVFVKGGDQLTAVDRFSGQLLWQYAIGGSESDMPVVHGDTVYVSTSYYRGGYLAAVNASSGTELWRIEGQDVSAPASSPLVADNTVFFMTSEQGQNDPDTFVYALDPATGAQRWRYEANGLGGQPPAAGGGNVYIQGEEDDYIAIDIATGEKQWESDGPFDAAPIYADGRVVLVGETGGGVVLDAADGEVVWERELFDGGRGSLGFGSGPYAAVSGSVIYLITDDDELLAVDAASGRELWRAAPGIDLVGSPTVTNEAIYVGTRGGFSNTDPAQIPSVVAFSRDGGLLWQVTLNPSPEAWDVGLEVSSPIAVSDGVIYVVGHANNYGGFVVALSG